MFLVAAATEFEMNPFQAACRIDSVRMLVTGIGPVETAVNLSVWLARRGETVQGVVHFGVAGAYQQPEGKNSPQLLDICLAEQEILGDLGICFADRIERFSGPELQAPDTFVLDRSLLAKAGSILWSSGIPFHSGTFVTVSCASGTARRGELLAGQYQGMCENMEGAAVARVCAEFKLPCLELRCISNLVEDRDMKRWQLRNACGKAGEVAALVVERLQHKAR